LCIFLQDPVLHVGGGVLLHEATTPRVLPVQRPPSHPDDAIPNVDVHDRPRRVPEDLTWPGEWNHIVKLPKFVRMFILVCQKCVCLYVCMYVCMYSFLNGFG
jgi:hypothetical protein